MVLMYIRILYVENIQNENYSQVPHYERDVDSNENEYVHQRQ